MEKPNVRFHDGQILSEEPLNKAMEAVDAAVDAANAAESATATAQGSATAAQESASAAQSAATTTQGYVQEIKEAMQNLPDGSAVSAQVATNTADISQLALKIDGNMPVIPSSYSGGRYSVEGGWYSDGTSCNIAIDVSNYVGEKISVDILVPFYTFSTNYAQGSNLVPAPGQPARVNNTATGIINELTIPEGSKYIVLQFNTQPQTLPVVNITGTKEGIDGKLKSLEKKSEELEKEIVGNESKTESFIEDKFYENKKGVVYHTNNVSMKNNANTVVTLDEPLDTHINYYIRITTDRHLDRFVLINPANNAYLLDVSNVDPLKNYVLFYGDAVATITLHLYQTNADGEYCNVILSVGKVEEESIANNKAEIVKTNKEIELVKNSMDYDAKVLFDGTFMLSKGDHELTSSAIDSGKTYIIDIDCDEPLNVESLTIYGYLIDRVSVSGNLQGKRIIYNPLYDRSGSNTGLRYLLTNPSLTNSYVHLRIVEATNYVGDKWSIVVRRSFSGSAGLASLAYATPILKKGMKYKLVLLFSEAHTIKNGSYLTLQNKNADNTNTTLVPWHETRIDIPASPSSTYLEIEFEAPQDIYRIAGGFVFGENPAAAFTGDSIILKENTSSYSKVEEVEIESGSKFSGFLMSYNSHLRAGTTDAQMSLAYSSDGLHFRKLVSPFSHDFKAEYNSSITNDFCIFKKSEYFYLTGSSIVVTGGNVVTRILKSKNLKDWTLHATFNFPTSMFPTGEGRPVLAIWAPEILELNGHYIYSFAVGEAENPYIEKGYIADLNDNLDAYSNVRTMTLNPDYFDYTFDNTFLWDEDKQMYFGYFRDGSVYSSPTLTDGTWTPVGSIPLQENGYTYMEGASIIKWKGWYYIYGDATVASTSKINNLLCLKTKDFKKYEVVLDNFDTNIRHCKVIQIDDIDCSIAKNLYLENV